MLKYQSYFKLISNSICCEGVYLQQMLSCKFLTSHIIGAKWTSVVNGNFQLIFEFLLIQSGY